MQHEDVMIGLLLRSARKAGVYFVMEKRCSFHDIHQGLRTRRVGSSSIMIHRVREHEYMELMDRFKDHDGPRPRNLKQLGGRRFSFSCLSMF
ncbi:hypothetical protein LSM04_009644 [Trypanosoma melophagium]|uniref:uncharacterized protein n=1 Tax=Trypanosoma melophagium TaxID=715481 RepID=UPI00351A9B40|nr:hypothetical protein LSM04_006605 [Trypanosoma melophagium]KAH9601084.1 hypothetical protein LSM04_009644 [Trypanosoma melophagium]